MIGVPFEFAPEQLANLACRPRWGLQAKNAVPVGGTCEACKASFPSGMEKHGTNRTILLCPACHAACHLRDLSILKAGRLLVSEKIRQPEMSLLSLGTAIMLESGKELQNSGVGKVLRQLSGRVMAACDEMQKNLEALYLSDHPKTRPSENYGSHSRLSICDPVVFLSALNQASSLESVLAESGEQIERKSLANVLVFVNPGALRRFARNEQIQRAFWEHSSIRDLVSRQLSENVNEETRLAGEIA